MISYDVPMIAYDLLEYAQIELKQHPQYMLGPLRIFRKILRNLKAIGAQKRAL